jgi:hypothetical protein
MYFPTVALLVFAGHLVAQAPKAKPAGLGNPTNLITSDIPMIGPIFPSSYLTTGGTGAYPAVRPIKSYGVDQLP